MAKTVCPVHLYDAARKLMRKVEALPLGPMPKGPARSSDPRHFVNMMWKNLNAGTPHGCTQAKKWMRSTRKYLVRVSGYAKLQLPTRGWA